MADPGGARPHGALACTAGLLAALVASHAAAAGQVKELVREATPLVLKDGRIAHVAIWSIPFRPGATELEGEVEAELAGIVETLATDCFLTAQAIGHVEPEAAKSGESLAAHRLARARADRIQRAMVERGLQASAIASVWDWQFLVKEPRVTVWVFRLHEGDDCEGKRLERPAAPAGAAAAPPGARELPLRTVTPSGDRQLGAAPTPPSPVAPAESQSAQGKAGPTAEPEALAPSPPSSATAAPPAASPAPTRPMPGSTPPPPPKTATRRPTPQAPTSLPGASASANEVLVSPLEAQDEAAGPGGGSAEPPSPSHTAPPATVTPEPRSMRAEPAGEAAEPSKAEVESSKAGAETTKAETEPAPPDAGRTAIAALGPVPDATAPGSLEIVFDNNSSYLPKGAVAKLRTFLKSLPVGTTSEVQLLATVGGADVKESSGTAGVRYNRWLAERRLKRVADWLKENAGNRRLEITTGFEENDPSRRVVLRVRSRG